MINSEELYNDLIKAGNEWADKNAAADLLEETKKSVLAELMNECENRTQSGKESEALASDVYRHHIRLMVAARREANIARVRYDSLKTKAELRRSEESTNRAEMMMR